MSNVVAGVVRGQFLYLEKRIAQKKTIHEGYKSGFKNLPVTMSPFDARRSEPNYWLSCLLIDEDAMCKQVYRECDTLYISESGKSCPAKILEKLAQYNAEGRSVWRPMHMQPIYRVNGFVTREGNGQARTNAYISGSARGEDGKPLDVGTDIFRRGLCLPSDDKMTAEQQEVVVEIVRRCFHKWLIMILMDLKNLYRQYIERVMGILYSFLFLVLLWWLFVLAAFLVRVRLGSPILFAQDRPGKKGKVFKLYKFRFMVDKCDKEGDPLPDDERLPKFGRILRSTSLNKLPEIFNVLKGDMSVVGPRPLLAEYLPYYTKEELRRHEQRPGLTGWAQING